MSFDLRGEIVLFLEPSGQVVLLDATASKIWRGLDAGLEPTEICEALAASTSSTLEGIERDCEELFARWRESRLPGSAEPAVYDANHPMRCVATQPVHRLPIRETGQPASYQSRFCLMGFNFDVRSEERSIAKLVDRLLGHLSTDTESPATSVFEIVRLRKRYELQQDGRTLDSCQEIDGVAPMIHCNVLLAAYRRTDCLAALHAAAVVHEDRCILLAGASGSGKSTLTAALLCNGFQYCADDLVLLSHPPTRMQGMNLAVGLKEGSWAPLKRMYPELTTLPIYRRADGKRIRYFAPESSSLCAPDRSWQSVAYLVFPKFVEDAELELTRIRPGEALMRLTEAGYDVPRPLDREVVSGLVDWLSELPCYTLGFSNLREAVDAISMIAS